jgi:mono/diheme cytochrome c family protein
MVALCWLGVAPGAGQAPAEKLYSPAQAKQGLATYDRKCATCHDGGTMGPELWGEAFLAQWADKDLFALYTRMKDTMPEDKPGSLTESETLGIVAFVLQQNDLPGGDRPIESASQLKDVKFQSGR